MSVSSWSESAPPPADDDISPRDAEPDDKERIKSGYKPLDQPTAR